MRRLSLFRLASCVTIAAVLFSSDQRTSSAADTPAVAEPLAANDLQRLQELEAEINSWLVNDAEAIQRHLREAKPIVDPSKIVQISEKARTTAQYIENARTQHAIIVDRYLSGTVQSESVRDLLRQGLEVAFDERTAELPTKSYEQLKALSQAENVDPVILSLYLQESFKRKPVNPKELSKRFVDLDTVFQSSNTIPPVFRFLLKAWIWRTHRSFGDVRTDRFRQDAFREAARFLNHGEYRSSPDLQLSVVRFQLNKDALPISEQKSLYEELLRERGIDPWILHVAAGAFNRNLAWSYRIADYSKTREDRSERFTKYIKKANDHYVRAWHLHPELPRAPAELIAISYQGEVGEWKREEWFATAISTECDYENAYAQYTWMLNPRNGGSQEQLLDFARQCLATHRWDTRIPLHGMNVLEAFQRGVADDELLGKNERAKSLADDALSEFQSAALMNRVSVEKCAARLCSFAVVELQAGDWVRARLAFDLLGTYGQSRWDTKSGMSFGHAISLAYALTGSQAERAQAIHTMLSEKQPDLSPQEIQKSLAEVEQLAKDDQELLAAGFYQSATEILRQLQQYSTGQWVELKFDPAMETWIVRADSCEVVDADTVVLRGSPDFKFAFLEPMARFSLPFLVEAEVKNGGSFERNVVCGITVRSPAWGGKITPQAMSVDPEGKYVVVQRDRKDADGKPTVDYRATRKPIPEYMPLAIRNWAGAIEYFGNHDRIVADLACEIPATTHLHFGSVLNGGSTRDATFRHLRIRKLPFGPPPADDDLDRNLKYYQQVVELLPESAYDNFRLGHFLLRSGKSAEAVVCLDKALKVAPSIKGLQRDLGDYYFEVADYTASSAAYHKELEAYGDEEHVMFRIAWLASTAPFLKLRDGAKSQRLLGRLNKMLHTDQTPNFRCSLTQAVADARQKKFESAAASSARALELAKTADEKAIAEIVHAAIAAGTQYRMPQKPKDGEVRY